MFYRPVDDSGDILPVQTLGNRLSGPQALSAALTDWLNLHAGEWWEYDYLGNPVLTLQEDTRGLDKDLAALSAAIVTYLLSFPAPMSVMDANVSRSGTALRFSCTVRDESGTETRIGMEL